MVDSDVVITDDMVFRGTSSVALTAIGRMLAALTTEASACSSADAQSIRLLVSACTAALRRRSQKSVESVTRITPVAAAITSMVESETPTIEASVLGALPTDDADNLRTAELAFRTSLHQSIALLEDQRAKEIARETTLFLLRAFLRLNTQITAIRTALSKPSFCSSIDYSSEKIADLISEIGGITQVRQLLQMMPLIGIPGKLLSRWLGINILAKRIAADPLNPYLQFLMSQTLILKTGVLGLIRTARVVTGHGAGVLIGQGLRMALDVIDGPKTNPTLICLYRAADLASRRLAIDPENNSVLLVLGASCQYIGMITAERAISSAMFERALRCFVIILKRATEPHLAADACHGISTIYRALQQVELAERYKRLGVRFKRVARRRFKAKLDVSIFDVGLAKLR